MNHSSSWDDDGCSLQGERDGRVRFDPFIREPLLIDYRRKPTPAGQVSNDLPQRRLVVGDRDDRAKLPGNLAIPRAAPVVRSQPSGLCSGGLADPLGRCRNRCGSPDARSSGLRPGWLGCSAATDHLQCQNQRQAGGNAARTAALWHTSRLTREWPDAARRRAQSGNPDDNGSGTDRGGRFADAATPKVSEHLVACPRTVIRHTRRDSAGGLDPG